MYDPDQPQPMPWYVVAVFAAVILATAAVCALPSVVRWIVPG